MKKLWYSKKYGLYVNEEWKAYWGSSEAPWYILDWEEVDWGVEDRRVYYGPVPDGGVTGDDI